MLNLFQLLKSLLSKLLDKPALAPAPEPDREIEDVPPPPLLPLDIVDVLTSSGQYPDRLNSPECVHDVKYNAAILISRVNNLLRELGITQAGQVKINSGFRTQAANKAAGGAPSSCHLFGMAVDLRDPDNSLEARITDELLEKHDLYREAPGNTRGWVHLQTRPTSSRTFQIKPRVIT